MPTITDLYRVDLEVALAPRWTHRPPKVAVRLDHELVWSGTLESQNRFEISRSLCKGVHTLEIELHSKSDLDPDQSVQISHVMIGKIQSPRFIWQGTYTPSYPEPWASQQRAQGIELEPQLLCTDYLGWNGTWSLEFSVPVFTWVHQVENLGWIYD